MTRARDLADNAEGSKPKVVNAKGDLVVGDAADSAQRLAVGSTGQYLGVNSATATGLEWISVAGDDDQFILGGQIFG